MPCAGQILEQFRQRDTAVKGFGAEKLRAGPFERRLAGADRLPAQAATSSGTPSRRATSFERQRQPCAGGRARCAPASAFSSPGSRTVSTGSSASAVPMPTRIASASARIRCTCRRAIVAGDRDLARALPADHAVAGKRQFQSHFRPLLRAIE